MALVMDDALRYMREHRYHVSMLFGIPDFYHRWGFATALAEYSTTITLRDASPEASPACRIRKIKPGDIPAVQRMHAANDEETACSLVRSAAHISNQWTRWEKLTAHIEPWGGGRSRVRISIVNFGALPAVTYSYPVNSLFTRKNITVNAQATEEQVVVEDPVPYTREFSKIEKAVEDRQKNASQ